MDAAYQDDVYVDDRTIDSHISNVCGANSGRRIPILPLSTRFMGPDIVSQTAEPADLQLGWSRGLSLTARILAVNLFVLALLGRRFVFSR